MKRGLEEFIQRHREEFDDLKAPDHVWHRIDKDLGHISKAPAKVSSLWKWTAIAASMLLLVSVGFIIGSRTSSTPDVAGWNEYEKTEQYYEEQIQEKMNLIKTHAVSNEVLSDIKVLDDVYLQLKSQLLEDPNADPQMLLNVMIRHQQQKLQVMQEILNRVEKYNTNENEIREM